MPSCRVRESLSRVTAVFSVDKEGVREMSNSEECAYQSMLRDCEESLFSQQVGGGDETELESEE